MVDINFKVDYVVKLPLEGNNPKVTIYGKPNDEIYKILFIDKNRNELLFHAETKVNNTIIGQRQWHTDWLIQILDTNGNKIYENEYDPTFKKVFIKIDAYALGDNLAWMPYIEEYRKKYNCEMICSTFHNHLFQSEYPEILFVQPNTIIENVYSQFYIGAVTEPNIKYCPITSIGFPLQMVATTTLGLDYKEIKPRIGYHDQLKHDYGGKYVCVSEFGSTIEKLWHGDGNWQIIIDYLNIKGFKVVVISKETSYLENVINKSGDIPLNDRIADIEGAEFYMGVSSGLAWLSWAIGTPVIMISDVTPKWHEFQNGNIRLGGDNLTSINYNSIERTKKEQVIGAIDKLITNLLTNK